MLKHDHLISQLSEHDKIRVLCDIRVLSEQVFRSLGVPRIKIADLKEYLAGEFPSPVALANSWDRGLVGAVAAATVKKMTDDGVNLAVMPSPKLKINPYRAALSEDPYLATVMAGEYCGAAKEGELASCLDDFRLTRRETDWMDREPDERFIHEAIVEPYIACAARGECVAVLTDSSQIDTRYQKSNDELACAVKEGRIAPGAVAFSRVLPAEHTVSHFASGGLAIEASSAVLASAFSKYKQMKKAIEQGQATTEELQLEIMNGKAISEEMLDAAVDRLFEFAFSIKRKRTVGDPVASDDTLAARAVGESIVMLKNDASLLPLKPSARISVIGDMASSVTAGGISLQTKLESALKESAYPYIGYERGYELEEERSDDLLAAATELAAHSDVALVFLGFGEAREKRLHKIEKLSIPANQQALLAGLSKCGTKIVAILPSDYCPDVGLEEYCHAILLAPLDTPCSAEVLLSVLSGALNPSGKLASTVYRDSDVLSVEHKTYRLRDRIKTGQFIGYRYYDTADSCPGYPFGFGLGYTQFQYSKLALTASSVRFTVKNTGQVRGCEIAQVYIGMPDSSVLRPAKELMDFTRIDLAPGEKKTVTLPLRLPSVYAVTQKRALIEQGSYTVFVGASVRDIRLSQSMYATEATVTSDKKKLSDYIQSESNIITDDYKLEARCDTMKKSMFNLIVGSAAIVAAISLKLFCVFAGLDAGFLDLLVVFIGMVGISLFIYEAVIRNRIYQEKQEAIDQKNQEAFIEAEKLPKFDAKQMFVDEFDHVEEEQESAAATHSELVDSEYFEYVDKEQSFLSATREFELFAAEKGYQFDTETVKMIFASLASSRLLVIEGMDPQSFEKLMVLLSTYFETSAHIDTVNESYTSADSVLFASDSYGNRVHTHTFDAVESAISKSRNIHFAALDNVRVADLAQFFRPFVNYVKNPLSHCYVTVLNDKNMENSHFMPPNLWFVLNLANGEKVDQLPDFITEVATVNRILFSEKNPVKHEGSFRKFSFYQMEYLVEKALAGYAVDEELWKKIDRLESYVATYAPYHIGNKRWLCMEKYALVYLSCESEQTDAVDSAVCAKLLPSMLAALREKLPKDEKSFSETVEGILGEDHAERCLRLIKTSGAKLTEKDVR